MTKTLTEQYKNKELSGWYYVKAKDGSINHWLLFTDSIEFDKDGDVKEVLAPVPSYQQLYGPNDGRIPVGLFTVLKLIKRDIEQYQKIRHLTDLECGIKSQVISLLKKWGIK